MTTTIDYGGIRRRILEELPEQTKLSPVKPFVNYRLLETDGVAVQNGTGKAAVDGVLEATAKEQQVTTAGVGVVNK
jgi:hypothetical protein